MVTFLESICSIKPNCKYKTLYSTPQFFEFFEKLFLNKGKKKKEKRKRYQFLPLDIFSGQIVMKYRVAKWTAMLSDTGFKFHSLQKTFTFAVTAKSIFSLK